MQATSYLVVGSERIEIQKLWYLTYIFFSRFVKPCLKIVYNFFKDYFTSNKFRFIHEPKTLISEYCTFC